MRTMLGGVVVALGLLGLLVACSGPCHLVGCTDQLVLEVRSPDGGLVETFRGTVTLDGQESTFECPSTGDRARDCVDGGIMLDLSWIDRTERTRPIGRPAMAIPVSVTALDGGLSWSRSITQPTTWFPNGPACGGECIGHVERVVLEPR